MNWVDEEKSEACIREPLYSFSTDCSIRMSQLHNDVFESQFTIGRLAWKPYHNDISGKDMKGMFLFTDSELPA